MKYYLMTTDELKELMVKLLNQDQSDIKIGLILEILEYRKSYGPLGCDFLVVE